MPEPTLPAPEIQVAPLAVANPPLDKVSPATGAPNPPAQMNPPAPKVGEQQQQVPNPPAVVIEEKIIYDSQMNEDEEQPSPPSAGELHILPDDDGDAEDEAEDSGKDDDGEEKDDDADDGEDKGDFDDDGDDKDEDQGPPRCGSGGAGSSARDAGDADDGEGRDAPGGGRNTATDIVRAMTSSGIDDVLDAPMSGSGLRSSRPLFPLMMLPSSGRWCRRIFLRRGLARSFRP